MRIFITRLIISVAFAVSLASCSGVNATTPVGPAPAPTPVPVLLRFINGSPDAATADLCLDGSVLATAPYGSAANASYFPRLVSPRRCSSSPAA